MENDDKFDKTIDHNEPTFAEPRANWGRRSLAVALAAIAVVGTGVALAQGGGFGPERMARFGMGFAEHRAERIFDEIDATDEQEKKIWAIVDATRADLRPVGREFRQSRDEVAQILGAATIDRAAAEKLRAERVAAIDEASRKVTTAALDAAEVLTPEQRTKLLERFKERRESRW